MGPFQFSSSSRFFARIALARAILNNGFAIRVSAGRKLRGEVLASLQQHLATAHWQRDTVLAANIGKVIDEVANLKKGVYGTWLTSRSGARSYTH